jgi:hypothetical protein
VRLGCGKNGWLRQRSLGLSPTADRGFASLKAVAMTEEVPGSAPHSVDSLAHVLECHTPSSRSTSVVLWRSRDADLRSVPADQMLFR